jgi:hypothetical protein
MQSVALKLTSPVLQSQERNIVFQFQQSGLFKVSRMSRIPQKNQLVLQAKFLVSSADDIHAMIPKFNECYQ